MKIQCIPVAHSATKVWACFLSTGLFSLLTRSWDRKWSMKSRGVTDARSHFNLFKTSISICCGWWGQRGGQNDRFKWDSDRQMQGLKKECLALGWHWRKGQEVIKYITSPPLGPQVFTANNMTVPWSQSVGQGAGGIASWTYRDF